MLIPGFLAGDASLTVMSDWLKRMGYRPHGSGIRFNVDCSERIRMGWRSGWRGSPQTAPAAIIGHSRGGHFAKALAHRRPDLVGNVISMGAGLDTPFAISVPTLGAVVAVRTMQARRRPPGCFTTGCACDFSVHYRAEFPEQIPLTSIYSRGDGVVQWRSCVVPYARCVEVTGSHIGLAFNRKAYRAIADALAASVVDPARGHRGALIVDGMDEQDEVA